MKNNLLRQKYAERQAMSEKTKTEPETGPAESETWKIIDREEQLEAKKTELEEKLARLKKNGG